MRRVCVSFIVFVVLLLPWSASGELPVLETGVYIYDGAVPLVVDLHSTPEVVDWNNDGKKDLIVGQFTNGRIWLFLNQGTDQSPSFNGGQLIYASGSPIQVPYG